MFSEIHLFVLLAITPVLLCVSSRYYALALMSPPTLLQERIALSLATLPAPKNKYELVGGESIASTEEDELAALLEADAAGAGRGGSSAHIADAGELEARRIAAEAAAAAAEFRRRSAALRHLPPLPRPLVVNEEALAPPLGAAAAVDPLATADALIRDEMVVLLRYDAFKYPVRIQDAVSL